jgi:hypothetical protein
MVLNRSKALRVDQVMAITGRISAAIPTTTFWLGGSGTKYSRNIMARVTRPPREPVAATLTGMQRSITDKRTSMATIQAWSASRRDKTARP